MRRLPASLLIPFFATLGFAPACFPSFAVGGDGGAGADDGGANHDATVGSSGSGSGGGSGSSSGGSSGAGSGSSSGSGSGSSSGSGSGSSSGGNLDGGSVNGGAYVPAGNFTFVFSGGSSASSTNATFSHAMLMDVNEVTVAQFTAWVTAGRALPADGQSLDPGGPYATQMYWQQAWNTLADAEDYKAATGTCTMANDLYSLGGSVTALAPTYGSTTTSFPINCVNWYQAVAYCASVGKRLPTQAEWQYEAVGQSHGYLYPWGDAPTPTDCSIATWLGDGGLSGNNGCGFPVPVGSAPKGKSLDGVLDLEGSLEEWIWDAFSFNDNTPWPADYAGTPEDAGTVEGRDIRGGSSISPVASLQSILPANLVEGTVNTNLGFRCVKSVL